MRLSLIALVLAVFSLDGKECDLSGRHGPYPGVDEARLTQLQQVKTDRLKEQTALKIEYQRLELDLKEMLLEGADLPELQDNCNKRGEIWAKIQYAQLVADAKRREVLSEEEWDRYLAWKLSLEATMKKGHSGLKKVIVKPIVETEDCAYIVAGTIKYFEDGKFVALVDYGDGECDNIATKTVDGKTFEIKLDK